MENQVKGAASDWITGAFRELRLLLADLGVTKTDLLILIVIFVLVAGLLWKLPDILRARNEWKAVKLSHEREKIKLQARLKAEQERRLAKAASRPSERGER